MRGGFNSYQRDDQNNTQQLSSNIVDTNEPPANLVTPSPHRPQPLTPQPVVRYGECLKNHAASTGGHVTDGCGEFMPSSEDGLKCAACDCHRSFHRKEAESSTEIIHSGTGTVPYHPYNIHMSGSSLGHRATVGHLVTHQQPQPHPPLAQPHLYSRVAGPPVMMAFGGGVGAESSSEDLNLNHGQSTSKKRFRTKFSQDQKGKMREFAERIGWKIQKQNESQVQQFCAEAGVKRQVFKVWLHNFNQASKKKQS